MPLENSLNDVNRQLLEKLQKVYDISFGTKPTISCWQVVPSFKISSPNGDANPSAMAHELLHIDLHLRGFADNILLVNLFNSNDTVFSPEFIAPLNNSLAHFKMIDEFLKMGYFQDTPKEYFLDNIMLETTALVIKFKAGALELCREILKIVHFIGSAKLFELYKIKDPNTLNGLHPDLVLKPLKEINEKLVNDVEELFEKWKNPEYNNNLWFFQKLDAILKEHNIPTYDDCHSKQKAVMYQA